jgi:hypothetical protein
MLILYPNQVHQEPSDHIQHHILDNHQPAYLSHSVLPCSKTEAGEELPKGLLLLNLSTEPILTFFVSPEI